MPTDYLAGYPEALVAPVRAAIGSGRLADALLRKYPQAHAIRTDKGLYDYVLAVRGDRLRNAPALSKVAFDGGLHAMRNALGTHTAISRVQGGKLKAKREIRIATVFREMPEDFLRMVVAHELAHLREYAHNKAFYQLCRHLAADYAQLEFDLRAYLCYLEATGEPLWR